MQCNTVQSILHDVETVAGIHEIYGCSLKITPRHAIIRFMEYYVLLVFKQLLLVYASVSQTGGPSVTYRDREIKMYKQVDP